MLFAQHKAAINFHIHAAAGSYFLRSAFAPYFPGQVWAQLRIGSFPKTHPQYVPQAFEWQITPFGHLKDLHKLRHCL